MRPCVSVTLAASFFFRSASLFIQSRTCRNRADFVGKPIASATLMLYSHKSEWGLDNEVIETVQSGADGSYHFTKKFSFKVPTGTTYNDYYIITATHPQFAFGWAVIVASAQSPAYDIVLTKLTRQAFIVKDPDGKAVSGERSGSRARETRTIPSRRCVRTSHCRPTSNLRQQRPMPTACATCDHLPNTQVSFKVSHAGFADSWCSIAKPSASEVAIKLTPAGVVAGPFAMKTAPVLSGAIVWFEATWMSEKNFGTQRRGRIRMFHARRARRIVGAARWQRNLQGLHHPRRLLLGCRSGQRRSRPDDRPVRHHRRARIDPARDRRRSRSHKRVPGVRMQAVAGERRLDGFTDTNGTIESAGAARKGGRALHQPAGRNVHRRQCEAAAL